LQIVRATAIPKNWKGVDVGPDAIRTFNEALDNAQTIIWDGLMGVSEFGDGTEVNIILPSIISYVLVVSILSPSFGT
jgi:3-phosphoglycerate kinase